MFDELERLHAQPALQQLLSLYAEAAIAAPGEWQPRAKELDGIDSRTLPRLHGELLAHEWIEQNTAHTLSGQGTGSCYRATEAGLQALKQVLSGITDGEDVVAGIASRKEVRRSIRKERKARRRAPR